MTVTQITLSDDEASAIGDAADLTGWTIDDTNDVCLELRCVGTGTMLGLFGAFILAVERSEVANLADTLVECAGFAESCMYLEHGYEFAIEFPRVAPLDA